MSAEQEKEQVVSLPRKDTALGYELDSQIDRARCEYYELPWYTRWPKFWYSVLDYGRVQLFGSQEERALYTAVLQRARETP